MASKLSDQEIINDGEAVASFLATTAWEHTLARIGQRQQEAFIGATTPDGAVEVWREAQALKLFLSHLNTTKSDGEIAKIRVEKAKKK